MATIKLKKPDANSADPRSTPRAPVRGSALKTRPTLAQAQAQRAEREALYQEQLRQRFGDRPPANFQRRDEPAHSPRSRGPVRQSPEQGAWQPASPDLRRSAPPQQRRDPRSDQGRDPRSDQGRYAPSDQRQYPAPGPRHDPRFDQRNAPPTSPRPRRDPLSPATVSRNAPFDPRARQVPQPTGPHSGPNTAFGQRNARPGPPVRDDARHSPPPPQRGRSRARDDDDDDHYREPAEHAPGSMRLSKRMSELGIASRREADEWIGKGWVRVDDQVVSELGSRVLPTQRVTVDAKAKFQQAQRVTVIVNKPVGYVSGQAEDGYEPALVLVTPDNLWHEDHSGTRFLREHLKSLVPAGRLDIDSVGLLVLTQDGRVAKQLIGEDSEIEKEYLVRVAMPAGTRLPDSSLALLRHGMEIDGEALKPAQVEWVNDDQLRFVLTQGKKRQIRRMCEGVGLQVLGLKRVRIGKVMLGDLPTGQWRYLRADEAFE